MKGIRSGKSSISGPYLRADVHSFSLKDGINFVIETNMAEET